MALAVCTISIATRLFSKQMLIETIKKKSVSNIIEWIIKKGREFLGYGSNIVSTVGNSLYSKLIEKCGSYGNIFTAINTVISTTLYTVFGLLSVACLATGGIGAIVWAIISYLLGSFTPGIAPSIALLIGSLCGIINRSEMKIRWLCGWGTNLYY